MNKIPSDRALQRTYRFDPNASQAYRSTGVSLHCLQDDLRHALKPSFAKQDARLELIVENIVPRLIYNCFSPTWGDRGAYSDLEHFIELTGIELLTESSRALELVSNEERFFVSGIYPGSWQVANGTLRQTPLPPSDSYDERLSREIELLETDYIVLRNKVLTSEYTAELQSRLELLDRWLLAVRPGSPIPLDEAQMDTQVAILHLTSRIGWPPRPTPKGMTGSYFADRTLRFRAFVAELRRDIVDGMNDILERFGIRYGFKAKLSIAGLRTAQDFDDLREALASGLVGPDIIRNCW